MATLREVLSQSIRERGPLTVAAFMDLALYHPELGYYARATQRSGRAGDFFTSVDVGATFGDLLEVQIAEMAVILGRLSTPAPTPTPAERSAGARGAFHLVEAGAGNGRLASDILRAAKRRHADLFAHTALHLVEASAAARDAQVATLDDVADRLVSSTATLPSGFEGVLLANELLDALPVHQVVMRTDGLREVYVDLVESGDQGELAPRLAIREGPLSTAALSEYLRRLEITLEPGWRAEINLRAVDWIEDAARRLKRGFIILIDYGHEASELYGVTHSGGTLTTFARHTMAGAESARPAPWLTTPGERDITAHVDFTTVRRTAEAEGLATLGFLDQTYFLMGLLGRASEDSGDLLSNEHHSALKTLLMPGGLGSTLKVLLLGKDVGTPALMGCSYRMRVT